MSIPGRKLDTNSVSFDKLSAALQQGRHMFIRGDHQPGVSAPNGYSAPTGTAADINRCLWRGGGFSQFHVKAGGQTLLGPLLDSTGKGVDLSQDQTNDHGVEHVWGSLNTYGPTTLTVGTDNGFVRMKFRIADVSGTDDCALGFRKNEAFQANLDDYDEMACLNVILGAIKTETILNGGTTTTTDTGQTWIDDATHTLEVQLRGTSVTYMVDGARVGTAFNFDSGEVVVPFFFFLQAATAPGKVWLLELETGLLSEKGTVFFP